MIPAKSKAIFLVNDFRYYYKDGVFSEISIEIAKGFALIAVNEIINEYQSMSDLESIIVINDEVKFVVHQLVYWQEVKTEIQKQ